MKHYIIGIALALALVMGVAAFAEATDPAADPVPAVTETTPAEEAPTEEAPIATAEVEKVEDEQKALQDALDAYLAAKQDKAVADLEEELSEYVEAGSLTQEQADLILSNVKERMAAKNGECPSCGYDLRGKGRGNGWFGGKMGGMQRGQRPDAQSGATRRQGGTTPKQGGMQRGQQRGQQQMNGQAPQMNGGQQQMSGQQMPGMAQPQM